MHFVHQLLLNGKQFCKGLERVPGCQLVDIRERHRFKQGQQALGVERLLIHRERISETIDRSRRYLLLRLLLLLVELFEYLFLIDLLMDPSDEPLDLYKGHKPAD